MAKSTGRRRNRRVRETAQARYQANPEEGLIGVLYDSDVVIEILRGRRHVVDTVTQLEGSGIPTYYTPITVAEIHAGIRRGEEALTEAFFASRGDVVLDIRIGRRAGVYLARYSRSHGVEIADAFIAAAATVLRLRLWTLNRKRYPMTDVAFYEPPLTTQG